MSLPVSSLNLEQLKNQAKDLLKACRAGDKQALRRVDADLPWVSKAQCATAGARRFLLADALLVIARECGFPSWPRLKAHIAALAQSEDLTDGAMAISVPADSPTRVEMPTVHDQATHMIDLATQGDSKRLAEHFSGMPLRDILALRAALLAEGTYTTLVDTLIAGLRHEDSRVRYNCAGALDHLADDHCVEPLRELANDPVPRVRRMALHALSCGACKLVPLQTDDDLVALMIDRALSDPSIQVRRHATASLGACCHDTRAIEALQSLLEPDTDPAIRRNARQALRRQASWAAKLDDSGSQRH